MSLEELDFRFVTRHSGPYSEFLRRYVLAARGACESNAHSYGRFCEDLIHYLADAKNLMTAADHLWLKGTAPGPDGCRLSDFSKMELWLVVRELGNGLETGVYKRGPLKRRRVPKRFGSLEKRTIWLMNVMDRIVTRGALQLLTPLLESFIDPLSFCWPGRGTLRALAYARLLTENGHTTLIVEDARNAFDVVPRARLLQILRHFVPNDRFCNLIVHLVEPPKSRGILQGSALSMALLNLYLTHFLHRPWRQENLPPLLVYADDFLVGLRPQDSAAAVYGRLEHHLRNAGMQPKHGFEKAVVDLRYQTADWLGYRLRWRQGTLEIHPKRLDVANPDQAQEAYSYCFSKFAALHERDQGWRYQNSILDGLIGHLGPTLPFVRPEQIYALVAAAGRDAGFEEIWPLPRFVEKWQSAYERWKWFCEHIERWCDEPICGATPLAFADSTMDDTLAPWE